MTYYDILGVAHQATPEQIKRAYREQIRFFHPDVFDGSEDVAKIKTQQLNEAYEILSNPRSRSEYDLFLKRNGQYKDQSGNANTQKNAEAKSEKQKSEPPPKQDAPPNNRQQEEEKEKPIDEERVREEARKQEEKSKKFWRNAKFATIAAVAVFVLWSLKTDYQKKVDILIQEAFEEGKDAGYSEGYDEGYQTGSDDGFAEGASAGVDIARYEAKLIYTGVYLDPNMGLYHKEGCALVAEDFDFDIEEIAIENGLEPCHFCTVSSDYTDGYQAGYAAGWVDRANEILVEGQ